MIVLDKVIDIFLNMVLSVPDPQMYPHSTYSAALGLWKPWSELDTNRKRAKSPPPLNTRTASG